MRNKRRGHTGFRTLLLGALLFWTVLSCASSIAVFNQRAYENATSLKAETLGLMALASEPYVQHAGETHQLEVRVQAAREYAAGLPKNQLSAKQWEILIGPDLLGGFLALWKQKGILLPGDIEATSKNVSMSFDEIIRFEALKIRP